MPRYEPWAPERASEIIARYRHLKGATLLSPYNVGAQTRRTANGPSEWQEEYEELSKAARRIAEPLVAAE